MKNAIKDLGNMLIGFLKADDSQAALDCYYEARPWDLYDVDLRVVGETIGARFTIPEDERGLDPGPDDSFIPVKLLTLLELEPHTLQVSANPSRIQDAIDVLDQSAEWDQLREIAKFLTGDHRRERMNTAGLTPQQESKLDVDNPAFDIWIPFNFRRFRDEPEAKAYREKMRSINRAENVLRKGKALSRIDREAKAKVRADQINRALENQRRALVKEWATDPPYGIICGVRKLIEDGKIRPPKDTGWRTPLERHPVIRVRFEFGCDVATLDTPAQWNLRTLANCLMGLDGYTVVVHGHCDATGTKDHNLRLSRKRAEEAADFLVSLGVQRNRVTERWYGSQFPLDGDPESDRRVEVEVLGLGETAAKGVLEAFPTVGYFEIEESAPEPGKGHRPRQSLNDGCDQ